MNKASGGNKIPTELFQILKDDAIKMLHSIYHKFETSAVATGLEKVSFHSNSKEGQCQGMFTIQFTQLTFYQGHAQNPSS